MVKTTTTAKQEWDELKTNMADLSEEGLLDMSAPFIVKNAGPQNTETLGVVLTLNNALRMRREGLFRPCVIN